ncbi:MAG: mannose-phosphate guanylyltransferase [Actinomycetota bacterium]|jgi:mannose-1-phosphate guanylyltransferase|nr:mannose-phosphate guanylyltransferase [Actinomycetota bacterium]
MRHALILAGGSGTRLWPFSTAQLPKQLVPMLGGRSLLDIAVERAQSVVDEVWLGAGEQLRGAVSSVSGLRPDRLILEPSGRDTLPAVALGCATIAAADPDAVIAVLTSDHLIEPVDAFAATLAAGFELAESSPRTLVTFGVVPDAPATGFGYLELGDALSGDARVVSRFREKPDAAAATSFVEAGPSRFLWNSGMFVWRASTLLAAVEAFEPSTGALVREVVGGRVEAWDDIAKKSVDYGVMEPASTSADFTVAALPMSARWLDVGSWPAYGDAVGRDENGNAFAARVVQTASTGCVVASNDPDHLVTLVGCEGLVVVHTSSATLVMPAAQAQRVKDLHALVVEHAPDLA